MNICEIEVVYKPFFKLSERPTVASSSEIAQILRIGWSDNLSYCEEFKIILLNRANRVLGISHISTGGVAGTIADPKMIFQRALKANASGIILSHNHPSGNLKPSNADIQLTRKLKNGADFLDMEILDHIILTEDSYFSFADEGLI